MEYNISRHIIDHSPAPLRLSNSDGSYQSYSILLK